VLAVGDINFQKKCLGKMHDLAEDGQRTVLFVSHNMASVKALCNRAVLLQHGRLAFDGGVDEAVQKYVEGSQPPATGVLSPERAKVGTGEARFVSVQLLDRHGSPLPDVYLGQPFAVAAEVDVHSPLADAVFEIDISTLDGTYVTTSFSVDRGQPPLALAPGRHRVVLELDVTLMPDRYCIDLGLHHTGAPWTIDFVRRTLDFQTLNVAESGGDHHFSEVKRGFVRPPGRWRVESPSR
jgi:lipopolysaccharide transport system ATP-binding protein